MRNLFVAVIAILLAVMIGVLNYLIQTA